MTWPIVIAGLGAILMAAAGGILTKIDGWYRNLLKPSWQPPDWAFGPAWTVILALAAFAAARSWTDAPSAAARMVLVSLFALNAVLHVSWSLLFFHLRRPDWALMEVVALWLSIAALVVAVAPITNAGALALVPYLAWVGFAAFLNLTIVRLNRPFAATRQVGPAP